MCIVLMHININIKYTQKIFNTHSEKIHIFWFRCNKILASSVPTKLIFSANQRFCWAQAGSFLTLTLLSMPKPPIFWAHANTPKS